jgi:hypothetical protein
MKGEKYFTESAKKVYCTIIQMQSTNDVQAYVLVDDHFQESSSHRPKRTSFVLFHCTINFFADSVK